jgi:hypothetical protein
MFKTSFLSIIGVAFMLTLYGCGGGSGRAQSSLNADSDVAEYEDGCGDSAEDYIEPIEGGVYAVYGDTDENREFLDYIDWKPNSKTGIGHPSRPSGVQAMRGLGRFICNMRRASFPKSMSASAFCFCQFSKFKSN